MTAATLICSPTTEPHVEGATITFCHQCKRNVWIAASSVEYVAAHPLTVVWCVPCAAASYEDWVPEAIPGQAEELGIDEAQLALIRAQVHAAFKRRRRR